MRQIIISILKMKAGVRTYLNVFLLVALFLGGVGGGGGAENKLHVWIGATQMSMVLKPFWSENGC